MVVALGHSHIIQYEDTKQDKKTKEGGPPAREEDDEGGWSLQ